MFNRGLFAGLYLGVVCSAVYAIYPPLASILLKRGLLKVSQVLDTTKLSALVATLVDNFVHVPMVYAPTYIMFVEARGMNMKESLQQLKQSYVPTVSSCWMFWIPVMGLNFAFTPPAYRVRVVMVGSFAWSVFLDYTSHIRRVTAKEQ